MSREVIGQGAYGCVHKPSIHCKTLPKPGFKYKKYVSKFMKDKNARNELAEFVTIGKIDPNNKYHLGEPILCKPDLDDPNVKKEISKCKTIKMNEVEANPDNYSLLIMKFGGHDLKAFCNNLTKYLEKDKETRTDKFWLQVHHLIKGLKFFKDNGIVHYDIKPQNILFNPTDGSLKYIDFGLMRTKQEVINSSKINNNLLGVFHWSYPFDCGFMNKFTYNLYKNLTMDYRMGWSDEMISMIADKKTNTNTFNLHIKNPEAFQILFTYLNPDNTIPSKSAQVGYINSFFNGFDKLIAKNSYDVMLNKITDSIDVFGLGITLQFIANCFKRCNALNLQDYKRLSIFFHKMYDFNPANRVIDIDALISEYENILIEIGVLTRLGKSFQNNKLVNKLPAPASILNIVSPPQKLSPELQAFADKDAIEIFTKSKSKSPKSCPPDKELNPRTRRCVNKCKPGFTRNTEFKCKKTRKVKSKSKSESPKSCPPGKELNPRTRRCVKKCPPGYSRNAVFQCRKQVKT